MRGLFLLAFRIVAPQTHVVVLVFTIRRCAPHFATRKTGHPIEKSTKNGILLSLGGDLTTQVDLLRPHVFWDLTHGNKPVEVPAGKYDLDEVAHPVHSNWPVLVLRNPEQVGAPSGAIIGRTKVHFDDYMLVQGVARRLE